MYPVHRMKVVEYQFVGSCLNHAALWQINEQHHKSMLSQLLIQCHFAAGKKRYKKREKKSLLKYEVSASQ